MREEQVTLTDDHEGELEALLDSLAVHLVGKVREADVAVHLTRPSLLHQLLHQLVLRRTLQSLPIAALGSRARNSARPFDHRVS